MTKAQMTAVQQNGRLAAIITTRNTTFWLVDQFGKDGSNDVNTGGGTPRNTIVEWDDVNEYVRLSNNNNSTQNQFKTHQCVNYNIIDELIIIPN
jgi:hypothetical protein